MKVKLLLLALVGVLANEARTATDDCSQAVNRDDPNFVTASLLVASPGGRIFSSVGHACLRMECPTFKLDNCFSYESEDSANRLLAFFAGTLKMGMFAVPTQEYLNYYRKDGRGVWQYKLNLSPQAKVRLWKYLDDKVSQGADLPYDYEKRGCAQSTFRTLQAVIPPDRMDVTRWPEKFHWHRRQIFADVIRKSDPWSLVLCQLIVGTAFDRDVPDFDKIIIPGDLAEILKNTTVNGQPLLDNGEPKELVARTRAETMDLFTPLQVACVLLVLAFANVFWKKQAVSGLFLLLQSALGVFLTYLICFSNLPTTNWNWLFVPFNPLPLLLWRWRRLWARPYSVLILVWSACMFLAPENLTDPALVLLALATAIDFWQAGRA